MKQNADIKAVYETSEKQLAHQSICKSQRMVKELRLVCPWLTTWWGCCKVENAKKKKKKVTREWCHSEDATIITHQSGGKSQTLINVLRLVGPWLTTWQDWHKLEKLNKVVREWCHSEDAAIGLFGLWKERNMSLYEVGRQLEMSVINALNFENPIPFLGFTCTHDVYYDLLGGTATLYRSLLELSDLERKIVGNASFTGRCVRSDPLRVKGVESDQWLLIDCSDLEETNCIPPYHHLKFAVPKGLKIALSDENEYRFNNPSGYKQETYMAVGRATALGLSGLIVYHFNPIVIVDILGFLVSALQEQKEGEFVSPLEFLSFPSPLRCWEGNAQHERFRRVLTSLRDQIVLGKLSNLKCLNLGFLDTKEKVEDFDLRKVLYACPNLQVLELGRYWICDHEYLQNIKLPDNVHGPHNCIDFSAFDFFTEWKEKTSHLIGIFGLNDSPKRKVSTFGKINSFSSLRVLICNEPIEDAEIAGALAINCPALRFLQIEYSDLYRWYANWHELLKRLFVLILPMSSVEEPMPRTYPFRFFPEGCELRVLTVYAHTELLSWLEKLLNIIDACLPKLLFLNVIVFTDNEGCHDKSLSENTERGGNLKYRLNQKSVDLRFVYRDMDKTRFATLP